MNIKHVITHPSMIHKCYRGRQGSTQCADANVSKCTGIETESRLSHPEMWHDQNRQIQGVNTHNKHTGCTVFQHSAGPECQYCLCKRRMLHQGACLSDYSTGSIRVTELNSNLHCIDLLVSSSAAPLHFMTGARATEPWSWGFQSLPQPWLPSSLSD